MPDKKLISISELLSGLKAYILHYIDDDLPEAISSDVRQQFDNRDKD